MTNQIHSVMLTDGVRFNAVYDTRFKTNRISINFFMPLSKETVTVNALIPQLLKKGYNGCDSFTMFNRKLEELYGAGVETDIDKKGDYQSITIAITCIDDKFALSGESISKNAAQILSKMAFDPITEGDGFCEKDVLIEKKALIDTIEAEMNEKRIYAINSANRIMCDNEPSGLPRYGFIDDVEHITAKSAKAQYDSILEQAQVEIMFVGCGDFSNAMEVFEKIYKNAKRSYKKLGETSVHKLSVPQKEKIEIMPVSQAKLVFGFACDITSKSELAPAMRMMTSILGGTPSSKLFVNVREKLSLCYYCASRYNMSKGIMMIDSGVEKENIEKAKSAILEQIEQIKNNDFTDNEMNFALLSLKNSYTSIYDSDCSIESFYIGQLLFALSYSPEEEKKRIENVTREQIVEVAKMVKLDTTYLLTGGDK